MFLEHLTGTLAGGSINLFIADQAHITGKRCGTIHSRHLLRHWINGILCCHRKESGGDKQKGKDVLLHSLSDRIRGNLTG